MAIMIKELILKVIKIMVEIWEDGNMGHVYVYERTVTLIFLTGKPIGST